jgi:predicted metal-dependent hydrolase
VNYNIQYGKTAIEFSLDRRNRKTLAIHVYPDKHVEVVAPVDASMVKILEKVKKRASWIYRKQLEFNRIQPSQPKPEYQTGETFRYLGKQYRLKLLTGKPVVKLKNGRFQLTSPESHTAEQREKLLLKWFRERGRQIFAERFSECIRISIVIGVQEVPTWQIKVMPTRWGSCTKEGKIYLNPELVAAPKPCIDYVIFHEICHLKEHNHSPKFYDLLTKIYPDWKKWRDYLNENIEVRMI